MIPDWPATLWLHAWTATSLTAWSYALLEGLYLLAVISAGWPVMLSSRRSH
jgi:hypothetical protein